MKRNIALLAVLLAALAASFAAGQQTHSSRANAPRKQVIQPPNYKPTPSPLSPAILVGDTLYMSGATGGDPNSGQLAKGGFEPEFRQIMTNLRTVLTSADMDLSDVVAVTAYIDDMSNYDRFNEIYREYIKTEALPTRSTVAVKELARGAHVALTMTSVHSRK